MAELPTREELELLYREKGHDALVWYAWRNALRALPALDFPTFKHDRYKSFYHMESPSLIYFIVSICRTLLVLAQWDEKPKKAILAQLIDGTDKARILFSSPSANIVFRAASTAKIEKYAYMFAADTADTKTTNSQYSGAIGFGHSIETESKSPSLLHKVPTLPDITKFAIRDFALMESPANSCLRLFNTRNLSELWAYSPVTVFNHFVGTQEPLNYLPQEIKLLQVAFIQQLENLGLDFLAKDIQQLWKGLPLGKHARNYLKEISEADLNNPEALRSIILGDEAEKIHAVRTLLLGPGGAGKSSLADRLQGKPVEQIKTATLGIEYQNHQPLDLQKTFPESNPEQKDLSLYLWDFGGQTIFHGLHRAFLHENCVYILVVDSRHEQAPDEWLHQIRHLAGGNATVLLVTNQHDGCDIRQNEKRLLREFPDLIDKDSFHYFSCIDPEAPGLTQFVNELSKAALDSQKTVWKETLNIHQAIREYTEEKSAVFIATTQIKKIIRDNGKVKDSKAMISSLEQLGFLASITKGKLSYCLKPEWAVDRAYELLYSDTLRNNQGKLDMFAFDECFKTTPTEDQQSKLLDFLDHRSLCFELPESGEYFFPDAAIADEPETVAELLKQDQRLQIRFDLPYLPLGFHTRLVKPLFNQETGIQSSQHIWKQGFIQQSEDSHAIVQYLLRKSSIEVTLVGNPQHYARLLKKFYTALCSAVGENKTGLQMFNIRPFVFLEKQLFELDRVKESKAFSVHSVVELVKVLQAANGDLKQVYEDVKEMAADKKGDTHHHYNKEVYNTDISGDGQTAVGSRDTTMNQYLDKSHTEITADQRHQIAAVVGELLKDAGSLPTEQLVAVTETKKALDAPSDDAKAQNLLGKVWNGIDEVATFTKDKALPIAEFAIEHKESLGAALAATMVVLGS